MAIRRADPSDAPVLAAIARRAIAVTGRARYDDAQVTAWAASFTTATMTRVVVETTVLVATSDEGVVGFAGLRARADGDVDLDLLYVDPSWSRHGMGHQLVVAIEAEARSRWVSTLWADASDLALPLLERLGFERVGGHAKVVAGVPFANTWLVKDLAGEAGATGGRSRR